MEPLRRAFRGYEPAQVDRLVSGLYSQLEARLRENEELRIQNARLSDDIAEAGNRIGKRETEERAVTEALVSAHRRAEEVMAEARKEAETLLQVAREAAARYQEDLRGRIDDLNWQIERLTLQKQRFLGSFRELLESNLAQLAQGADVSSRTFAAADVSSPGPASEALEPSSDSTEDVAAPGSPVEVA